MLLYKGATHGLKFLMGFIKLERATLAFDILFTGNHRDLLLSVYDR